jgi:hypothetical protein
MANMIPISTVTVGSGGASNIQFTNIPQTYTDLMVVATAQSAGSGTDNITMYINGNSTGTNYHNILFRYTQSIGVNGAYVANSYFFAVSPGQTGFPTFAGGSTAYFPNYTNTSTQKGWNTKTGSSVNASSTGSIVGLFPTISNITAAITSITLSGYGLYPTSNSTFSLYGIS